MSKKVNAIQKEIDRLSRYNNRNTYQEIAVLQEEAAWALYESDAVQAELAVRRSEFRAEEQAQVILKAQSFQTVIVDKMVEEQQAIEAAAQKAALEAVMAAWEKAAARARWAYILASIDRAKCAVVNVAEATFVPYIRAMLRGYFWVKTQISAAIDAIIDTAADFEAELQLRWAKTQMADFVYDGQLFGVKEAEADAYYAFEEAKYAIDNGEAAFIEASDEEIARWHEAGMIYIDRTDNGAVYYNSDVDEINKARFSELFDLIYSNEINGELCEEQPEDLERIEELKTELLHIHSIEVIEEATCIAVDLAGEYIFCGGHLVSDYEANKKYASQLLKKEIGIDLQLFAAPVSQETEAVLNNTTDSSETADDIQAAEDINNKEGVNNSAVAEENSIQNKGGFTMEKKMQKKMFAMTKVSFVEAKKSNVGFFAYVTESSGEITEATAPFVSTDKPFKATTDSLAKVKAASTQIIELESSFDEMRDVQAKTNMAEVAIFRGRQVVDVYYRPQEVFVGHQSGELKLRAASYWVKLTGTLTYDKDTEMYSCEIVDEIPKTARIFTVYQRINTTSQGRKNLMYAFSTTQKRFDKIRDEVTCGMTSKYYGRRVNLKYNADFATRASAHDTHVISNMPVDSYAVLFGKNDPTDGNIIANAGYFVEGALDKQIRPYAAKGFCTLWPADAFKDTLSLYNLKVLVRNNISTADETALDAMLAKGTDKKLAKKHFAGFDGVMICDSEDQIPMLIMNQDAMKAAYDYSRINGLHVLAEADHDEDIQNLSGQLAKVFLQAGAESGRYDEAISLLSNYGVNHVNTYFDKTKEPIRVLGWNSDIIQSTMPLSVAAGTLGWDVTKYPYLMKTVLKDKLTRLSRDITRVNFGIGGKYLPAEPDVAAWFGLSVLKTTAEYVEVYVPGMTGYAVLLKYPSTGSNEYVVVRFVSLDEINERIDELNTDDLRKSIIRRVYASLKSGVCTISSDEVVRRMLAGFDFDGDHVLLVTAPELVEFMRKYGHPIAVYIDAPEDGTDEEIIISSASFAAHAYRMAKTGNRAVGQVVNLGRMFTNAMTALMARATTPAQREIMLGIMRKVFFNSNTYHGIKYESPFVRGELNGIQTVQLNRVMVNNMLSKAKHIALTRTNILAWLRDMDHAFRFYSELTIDAQKNLYEVAIKFAKYMKKSGYRISSNVCALEFAMNIGADGLITDIALKDGRILKDAVANKKGELKWIGDIMTPIRVAATEAAIERCMDMAAEYNDAVQVANAQRVAKQDEYIAKNDDLFATVNLLGRYSGALVRMARTEIANATKKLGKNVPHTIRQKLMDMAQARIKADFIAANVAMTNTYRRIASDYTTEELVERILAVSRGDRMLTDICQEEILKFFLDKENVQYRREIRLADGVSIADVESYVVIEDGAFSNQFGKVGYVGHDVADGIYDTVIEDGHAYIMQMASERIVVPTANENEFIVLFEGSAANDAAKYFDENDEACFGLNNGGFVGLRDAESIKQKAIVVTNSFSSSKQPIAVSTLFKNLVLNKKIEMVGYKAIAAEYNSNGQQTHKPQLLVICHELGTAPVVEQVMDQAAQDAMDIQNIFGDDLFC
jgi:hypothetical protein